jgi:hypothetical protein
LRAVNKVIVHRECADCNRVIEIFFVLIVTFKIRVSANIIIRPSQATTASNDVSSQLPPQYHPM